MIGEVDQIVREADQTYGEVEQKCKEDDQMNKEVDQIVGEVDQSDGEGRIAAIKVLQRMIEAGNREIILMTIVKYQRKEIQKIWDSCESKNHKK